MSDLTAEEICAFNQFYNSSSKKEQEIILNQMLDNVDKSLNEDAYMLPFKDAKVVSVFIGYMNFSKHFGCMAFRPHSDNKGWDKTKKVKEQVRKLVTTLIEVKDYTKANEVLELFDDNYHPPTLMGELTPILDAFDRILKDGYHVNQRDRTKLKTALKRYYLEFIQQINE